MIAGISTDRAQQVLLAGTGAVAAAFVQTSGNFGLGDNVRDVVLALGAMMLMAKGEGSMRAFGAGVGAAAVSSLIRRNILTAV
jgi:hypothetical protein